MSGGPNDKREGVADYWKWNTYLRYKSLPHGENGFLKFAAAHSCMNSVGLEDPSKDDSLLYTGACFAKYTLRGRDILICARCHTNVLEHDRSWGEMFPDYPTLRGGLRPVCPKCGLTGPAGRLNYMTLRDVAHRVKK